MDIYLTVMVTALVLTQIIRVAQNAVSLYHQNRLFKKQMSSLEDITQEDLDNQRLAYRLVVKYLQRKS